MQSGCAQAQITCKHTDDTQNKQSTGNPPERCQKKNYRQNFRLLQFILYNPIYSSFRGVPIFWITELRFSFFCFGLWVEVPVRHSFRIFSERSGRDYSELCSKLFGSGAKWLLLHHPGGCYTLVVVEVSPPLITVKCFGCEKTTI